MKHCILLLLSFLSYGSIEAQIFVKLDAAGNNDGTSWADAYTNLQSAIDASTTGGQLWIAGGTYKPQGNTPDSSHFLALKAIQLYGGFAGTESQLEERDPVINETILSGDKNGDDVAGQFSSFRSDNAHHVLILHATGQETYASNLVIQK